MVQSLDHVSPGTPEGLKEASSCPKGEGPSSPNTSLMPTNPKEGIVHYHCRYFNTKELNTHKYWFNMQEVSTAFQKNAKACPYIYSYP